MILIQIQWLINEKCIPDMIDNPKGMLMVYGGLD